MRRELAVHPGERPAAGLGVAAEAARRPGGGLALSFAVRGPLGGLRLPGRAAAPARADGLWRATCFEAFVAAGATSEHCYPESGMIDTGAGNGSTPTSPRPSPPPRGGEGGTRDSGRERWGGSRIHESRPYVEINLAPSGDWQAYAFGRYREGRRPAEPPATGQSGDVVGRHSRASGNPGLQGPSLALDPRLRGGDETIMRRIEAKTRLRPIALPFSAPAVASETGADVFTLAATLHLAGLPGLAVALPWRVALAAVIEDAAGGLSHWALAHPPGDADFHHAAGFALTLPPPAEEALAS